MNHRIASVACVCVGIAGAFGWQTARSAATEAPLPMPGPTTMPRDGPPDPSAACKHCHPRIAASWAGSLHHRSFSNADFTTAFRREPRAFCRGCHAPQADPTLGVRATPRTAVGVDCVSCHAPAGLDLEVVLGGTEASAAPHPVLTSASFGRADACAGCHEFGFPDDPGHLMQATIREHAASPRADTPCIDCHMPRRPELGGLRDHRFAASRDPDVLRSAVVASARRRGPEVVVTLTAGNLGHAFPTGDMFRRLVVLAACEGSGGAATLLQRQFSHGRAVEHDTRIGAHGDYAPREVTLSPACSDDAAKIRWAVLYQRTDMPAAPGVEPTVWSTIELAAGAV